MSAFSPQLFTEFLRKIDPTSTYTVVKLTGGTGSWTVRAIKDQNSVNTGIFADRHSFIIKFSPPFEEGKMKQIPVLRQANESKALTFLNTTSIPWKEGHGIEVASVLYHDRDQCMLVITDLGDDMTTLDRWLATNPSVDAVRSVGRRIGEFLAAIQKLPVTESKLDNPDMIILDYICEVAVERMKSSMEILDVEEGEVRQLVEMMRCYMRAEGQEGTRMSFTMGDMNPYNILVCPRGERVAVVDWEFAGRGHILHDVAKLAAFCHEPEGDLMKELFVKGLLEGFRGKKWLGKPMEMELIEAARILHGGSILRRRNASQAEYGLSLSDRRALVNLGLRYLRAARRGLSHETLTPESFLQPLYM